MARPIKNGLDYFPMDVDTDDKFELIEAKHGIVGFGVVVKLFQRIYKAGYYLDWTEDRLLIFKKSINVDINIVSDIINDCLRYKIFDEELFKQYNILSSSGIQKRYLQACDRRKSLELVKEYIIVYINSINADINWQNVDDNTQSKGKKSKGKKSKADIAETCPYVDILNLYHSLCPSLSKVAKLSDSRKEKVRLRFAEMEKNIETLRVVFENVEKSDFCKGNNERGWTASFDWIFENDKNWLKIYEGKYSNKSAKNGGVNDLWEQQ